MAGLLVGASGVMGSTWGRAPSKLRVEAPSDDVNTLGAALVDLATGGSSGATDFFWLNRKDGALVRDGGSPRCAGILDGLGCASVAPKVSHHGEPMGMQVIGVSRCALCRLLDLRAGDLITGLNAEAVSQPDSWQSALLAAAFDDTVRLRVARDGEAAVLSARRLTSTLLVLELQREGAGAASIRVVKSAPEDARRCLGLSADDLVIALNAARIEELASPDFELLSAKERSVFVERSAQRASASGACRLTLELESGSVIVLDAATTRPCDFASSSDGATPSRTGIY